MSDTMDRVARYLIREEITISAMESCTGGLFASHLTDTQGASAIFAGSFVTYSDEAKEMCGVDAGILHQYGVYSLETATAMAEACRARYDTELGVGITGTLGRPDPNHADSTPGEVFYAIVRGNHTCGRKMQLDTKKSSRPAQKAQVVEEVAETLAAFLGISDPET